MNNEFLTWLKENPSVSYIYNHGSIVYKTNTKDSDIDFLVVVKDDFQIPKQYKKYKYPHHFNRSIKFNVKHENHDFIFFKIDE
jgi:predicted nucleotidyltransferase